MMRSLNRRLGWFANWERTSDMLTIFGRALLVFGALALAAAAQAQAQESEGTEAAAPQTADEAAAEGDVIVARVGQDEIRLTDVIGEIYSLPEEEREKVPFDEMYDDYLQRRIDRSMIFQAAVASGLRDDPQHAERMKQIERRVLSDQFVQNLIRGQVRPEELKARYEAYVETAAQRTELRARHILANDETHANEIMARLDAGEPFEEVARSLDYPGAKRGGDLGYFNEDSMVPEIVSKARELEVGQVSDPFISQFGWHIIKLEDQRAERVRTKEEMREQLTEDASQEVVKNLVNDLRANFPIERFNRDGTPMEDAAAEEEAAPAAE
jgi:peptidyl-prolyl cis-trans isomerase C